jgi:DNA-binding NarL/FixJ family response regulator/class 3 adenylate cyclase
MSGTTTIVFTDIVASTDVVHELGDDAGAAALISHLRLLRAEVERHRGTVAKTLGDGIMALFDATYDGVRAAIAMQQAVTASATRPLRLRVGIHVGDVVTDADDVFGSAVILARRLCDTASPGQILVSELVHLLVANRPEPRFEPLGDLQLKGIPQPVAVLAVAWEPLPERPPVRVVVADDAALIRAGIVRLLSDEGFEIVAEGSDYDSLIEAVERTTPDLVVTDIRMPPTQHDEGLRAAAYIKEHHPNIAVLVLSQHITISAATTLLDGQPAGIGYILKERVSKLDEFVDSARRVTEGASVIDPLITQQLLYDHTRTALDRLTEREQEVLTLMAQGLSNQAISDTMNLSPKTIESHVRAIFTKLDLPDDSHGNRRVRAVLQWLDHTAQ